MDLKALVQTVNQIAEEKGIESARVLEAIESALASAYKKEYGKKEGEKKLKKDKKKD